MAAQGCCEAAPAVPRGVLEMLAKERRVLKSVLPRASSASMRSKAALSFAARRIRLRWSADRLSTPPRSLLISSMSALKRRASMLRPSTPNSTASGCIVRLPLGEGGPSAGLTSGLMCPATELSSSILTKPLRVISA
jgi:hypothetical protein